jgi:hypothetical protein
VKWKGDVGDLDGRGEEKGWKWVTFLLEDAPGAAYMYTMLAALPLDVRVTNRKDG